MKCYRVSSRLDTLPRYGRLVSLVSIPAMFYYVFFFNVFCKKVDYEANVFVLFNLFLQLLVQVCLMSKEG